MNEKEQGKIVETRPSDKEWEHHVPSIHRRFLIEYHDGTTEEFIGIDSGVIVRSPDDEKKEIGYSITAYPRNEIEGPPNEPLLKILISWDRIKKERFYS